jgi:hypothetical protein
VVIILGGMEQLGQGPIQLVRFTVGIHSIELIIET